MKKQRSVQAALKLIKERAAIDDKLLKKLDDLDRLSSDDALSNRGIERSRLPYSSQPPQIEPFWK